MQSRNRIVGGLITLGSLLLAFFKDLLFGWVGDLGIAMLPADTSNIFVQNVLPYFPALLVFILGISAIMGWGTNTTVHVTKPYFRSSKVAAPIKKQNGPAPPPDSWRLVDELTLWQIAHLWVGQQPTNKIPPQDPAYPILRMLKTDVTNYKLLAAEDIAGQRIIIHAEGERKSNVDMDTLIKRPTLLQYISNHNNKPEWDFGTDEISQHVEPQYDTPIYEAVNYVARKIDDRDSDQFYPRARQALRQAASDSRIKMYGEKELKDGHSSKLLTPIPHDYWSDQELNVLTTEEHYIDRDHTQPEQRAGFKKLGRDREKYWGVRVSMTEIEKKWP